MLKIEISPGESIRIGKDIVLTLEKKTGQVARLSFQADRSIPIERVREEPPAHRKMMGIGMAWEPT